jgi:hypothetical protein
MEKGLSVAFEYWISGLKEGRLQGADKLLKPLQNLRELLEKFPDSSTYVLGDPDLPFALSEVLTGLTWSTDALVMESSPAQQKVLPQAKKISEEANALIPAAKESDAATKLPQGYVRSKLGLK